MINFSSKLTVLSGLLSCALLAGCAEKKQDEIVQPDELSPAETQGLSLQEKEELKISEDNVMNTFPG